MIALTRLFLVLSFVTLFAMIGCSGNNPASRYEPPKAAAREAIERALAAWKSGAAFGTIEGKPPINVFDARWQGGEKLAHFEVLEEVAGTEHPQFKVRIQIEGGEEETNEFLVVGIEPLLVFRDQDYRKTSGM